MDHKKKIKSINQIKDTSVHRFGTAIAMQPRGMFAETLNQGMLEAAMHGYFDFWMRKNIFEKKAIATAAKYYEKLTHWHLINR